MLPALVISMDDNFIIGSPHACNLTFGFFFSLVALSHVNLIPRPVRTSKD